MDEPVNSRRRCHWVFKDHFPLREWKVTGNHHTSALVTVGKKREENLHLVPALLNVTDVIDNNHLVSGQPLEQP